MFEVILKLFLTPDFCLLAAPRRVNVALQTPRLCQTLPRRHWQSSAQAGRQQHLVLGLAAEGSSAELQHRGAQAAWSLCLQFRAHPLALGWQKNHIHWTTALMWNSGNNRLCTVSEWTTMSVQLREQWTTHSGWAGVRSHRQEAQSR